MKRFFLIKTVLIILSLCIFGCKKNDDLENLNNKIDALIIANDILTLKNTLLDARISENPITSIDTTQADTTTIVFESASILKVKGGLIEQINVDADAWQVDFHFSDASSVTTWYVGNENGIQAEMLLNPYNDAPLAVVGKIKTPIPGRFKLRVVGQDGATSDILHTFETIAKNHELEILGLYADYENTIELTFLSADGKPRITTTYQVKTEALPEGLPDFEIAKQYEADEQNTVFLVNFRPAHIPFMVDKFGKIRWYSVGFSVVSKYGLQRFKNGNMGFGRNVASQGSIFEYTMTGKVIREYSFYPEFEMAHHDVYEMANGNFLVPVNKVGAPTVEDYIIAMDRNSGEIYNVWDLNLILPRRDTLRKNPANDWVHVNAVIHDPSDNTIIISGQRQGLFKVTWDNQLKWIFSQPYDWDGYESYLLTSSDPSMEWVWGQHAPLIKPDGHILLFDNGFGRGFGRSPKFSRALEVKITENSIGGTVENVWEYGRERGTAFYAPFICDVDYLEATDTRLLTAGSVSFDISYTDNENLSLVDLNKSLKSIIVEVNRNKEVVFELHLKLDASQNGTTYRSEKIKLY